MLILMSLNSNKIITYHFGIEITLTKTVKARGYFLSTIHKSAISSINLLSILNTQSKPSFYLLHFTSH